MNFSRSALPSWPSPQTTATCIRAGTLTSIGRTLLLLTVSREWVLLMSTIRWLRADSLGPLLLE